MCSFWLLLQLTSHLGNITCHTASVLCYFNQKILSAGIIYWVIMRIFSRPLAYDNYLIYSKIFSPTCQNLLERKECYYFISYTWNKSICVIAATKVINGQLVSIFTWKWLFFVLIRIYCTTRETKKIFTKRTTISLRNFLWMYTNTTNIYVCRIYISQSAHFVPNVQTIISFTGQLLWEIFQSCRIYWRLNRNPHVNLNLSSSLL